MNKRKLLLAALSLCMVAILAMGGTLAYLTDTDNQVNTFTMGNVGLELDEGTVIKSETDGRYENTDTDKRTSETQDYKVFPGDVVIKDPTIHIDDDSELAWVASKIIVKGNLWDLIGVNPGADGKVYDTIDINAIVSGGEVSKTGVGYTTWNDLFCYETETAYIHQIVVQKDEEGEAIPGCWELYVFMKDQYKAGDDITLFTTVTIPTEWNNKEAALYNGSVVDISAYAVQADGFVDAFEAMTVAFKNDFAF